MSLNKKKIISFGPIGAGKTTTLRHLSANNKRLKLIETTDIIEKNTRLNFYLTQTVIEKNKQYFFPFQTEILLTRFSKLIKSGEANLIDESIFSTKAYSITHLRMSDITQLEFETFDYCYKTLLEILPIVNIQILYFYCSTESLMENILKRVSYEKQRELEKLYNYEYINTLKESFKEVCAELKQIGFSVKEYNTENKDLELLSKEIENELTL